MRNIIFVAQNVLFIFSNQPFTEISIRRDLRAPVFFVIENGGSQKFPSVRAKLIYLLPAEFSKIEVSVGHNGVELIGI